MASIQDIGHHLRISAVAIEADSGAWIEPDRRALLAQEAAKYVVEKCVTDAVAFPGGIQVDAVLLSQQDYRVLVKTVRDATLSPGEETCRRVCREARVSRFVLNDILEVLKKGMS